MKIKVNEKYITRGGNIATVVGRLEESPTFPFDVVSSEGSYSVTKEGYRYSEETKTKYDLVKKLKFKAGQSYYTNGNTCVILAEKEEQCGRYVYEGDNGLSYTAEGEVYLAEECIDDLIKPLKFKVGKKYLTRNGKVAVVTNATPSNGFYQYEIDVFSTPWFTSKFSISADGRLYRDTTSDEDIVSKFKLVEGQRYVDNEGDVYRYESGIMTQLTSCERGSQYTPDCINIVKVFNGLDLLTKRTYENEVGTLFQIMYLEGDLAIGLMKDSFSASAFNAKGLWGLGGCESRNDLLKEVK
jgi:hypothetical protein